MDNSASQTVEQFEFRGSAGEWFGIWIVNLLLSIVTLGIYSAWAKVRTKKYFYQNTYVGGRNFDYHARGLQILLGRLIVLAALIVFGILSSIPLVAVVLWVVLIVLTPWLIVRSLRFNAQKSSWSNVRFRFTGTKLGAFLVYILYPVLTLFTAYLAVPFLSRATKRYLFGNHALGGHKFSFNAPIGGFYLAFLGAIVWVLAVTALLAAVIVPGFDFEAMFASPEPPIGFILGVYLWAFLAFYPAIVVYGAMTRNVVFKGLALEGGHSFSSDVSPVALIWIALSNAIVTLCTFGLMLPWAQVRMARYLAMHTTFHARGSLDHFATVVEQNAGAVGDAYVDLEGIELGFGV